MLQVYHDPASTVPPQMADRITALRHALEKIALLASTSAAACNLAHEALYDDEQAQKAQDAANEADMRRQDANTADALESLQFMPDPEPPFDGCYERR